ncbi:MAG: DUF4276 family protein [Deltaproteobacteria bacterium]|nr:DUF4276 family protein [Deltaproteobacteria bacterium]
MNGLRLNVPNVAATEETTSCHYVKFGLIVTGKAEEEHLPKLFKSLTESRVCNFEVIRRVGQRSPVSSEKRKLEMVMSGKQIPDKDETEIGLPARTFLGNDRCRFVILVDDLERDREALADKVFERYRDALVMILKKEQRFRVAVHFLVNMLEAYFFADAACLNSGLNLNPPVEDYDGDVEDIPHPKNKLRSIHPGYDEMEGGGKILSCLDLEHVLSRSDTCAYLRTMFAWCLKVMERNPYFDQAGYSEKYRLRDGILSHTTDIQLAGI